MPEESSEEQAGRGSLANLLAQPDISVTVGSEEASKTLNKLLQRPAAATGRPNTLSEQEAGSVSPISNGTSQSGGSKLYGSEDKPNSIVRKRGQGKSTPLTKPQKNTGLSLPKNEKERGRNNSKVRIETGAEDDFHFVPQAVKAAMLVEDENGKPRYLKELEDLDFTCDLKDDFDDEKYDPRCNNLLTQEEVARLDLICQRKIKEQQYLKDLEEMGWLDLRDRKEEFERFSLKRALDKDPQERTKEEASQLMQYIKGLHHMQLEQKIPKKAFGHLRIVQPGDVTIFFVHGMKVGVPEDRFCVRETKRSLGKARGTISMQQKDILAETLPPHERSAKRKTGSISLGRKDEIEQMDITPPATEDTPATSVIHQEKPKEASCLSKNLKDVGKNENHLEKAWQDMLKLKIPNRRAPCSGRKTLLISTNGSSEGRRSPNSNFEKEQIERVLVLDSSVQASQSNENSTIQSKSPTVMKQMTSTTLEWSVPLYGYDRRAASYKKQEQELQTRNHYFQEIHESHLSGRFHEHNDQPVAESRPETPVLRIKHMDAPHIEVDYNYANQRRQNTTEARWQRIWEAYNKFMEKDRTPFFDVNVGGVSKRHGWGFASNIKTEEEHLVSGNKSQIFISPPICVKGGSGGNTSLIHSVSSVCVPSYDALQYHLQQQDKRGFAAPSSVADRGAVQTIQVPEVKWLPESPGATPGMISLENSANGFWTIPTYIGHPPEIMGTRDSALYHSFRGGLKKTRSHLKRHGESFPPVTRSLSPSDRFEIRSGRARPWLEERYNTFSIGHSVRKRDKSPLHNPLKYEPPRHRVSRFRTAVRQYSYSPPRVRYEAQCTVRLPWQNAGFNKGPNEITCIRTLEDWGPSLTEQVTLCPNVNMSVIQDSFFMNRMNRNPTFRKLIEASPDLQTEQTEEEYTEDGGIILPPINPQHTSEKGDNDHEIIKMGTIPGTIFKGSMIQSPRRKQPIRPPSQPQSRPNSRHGLVRASLENIKYGKTLRAYPPRKPIKYPKIPTVSNGVRPHSYGALIQTDPVLRQATYELCGGRDAMLQSKVLKAQKEKIF